ncbi:type II secretion system F family protein [bacterium]|nr:type II secretion system F family protein [bacterium]
MSKSAGREAVAVFFRSLATMLPAGVPLARAVELAGAGSPDPVLAAACRRLHDRLHQGQRLSASMAEHARVFSAFQIGLIKVGESSGRLVEVLEALAEYEEKARKLVLKFRSAMTYPLFVSLTALLLMVVSPPIVFRMLMPFLESQPDKIPFITRLYLGFCHLICSPICWLIAAGLATAAFRLFRTVWAQPRKRYQLWHGLLNRTGPSGRLLRTYGLARFARSFAILAEVGISPLHSLPLAAEVSGDPVLLADIPLACKALVDGRSLYDGLRLTGYFPKAFLTYLGASEECATVSKDFARLADVYDSELEHAAAAFASLLEPVIMMALGFSAGFMIFAVTLPMLNLMQEFM